MIDVSPFEDRCVAVMREWSGFIPNAGARLLAMTRGRAMETAIFILHDVGCGQ